MNAWGIFAMALVSVLVVGGMLLIAVWLFLRHINLREVRCEESQREIQMVNNEFHRIMNDNLREAFKLLASTMGETARTMAEARDAMTCAAMSSTKTLEYLARHDNEPTKEA